MFEDIKANIELLDIQIQKQGNISTEPILESMCRLFEDASAANHRVQDVPSFGYRLINLLYCILPLYARERDTLRALNDEDVSDAIAACDKTAADLNQVRTVLENLYMERDRLRALKEQLNAAEKEQSQLQKELAQIEEVSPEGIQAANHALKQKLSEQQERSEALQKARLELDAAEKNCAQLETQQWETGKQIETAEAELALLQKNVAEYEKWKVTFAAKQECLQQQTAEAAAACTAMRTAWESIRSREELPLALSSYAEFSAFTDEIRSFEELGRWFDQTGAGIDRALDTYAKMYQKMLELCK